MKTESKQIIIVEEDDKDRIDVYLADKIEDLSRTMIQKLLDSGNVLLNGKVTKAKKAVKLNDVIEITLPEPVMTDMAAENIP